MKIICLLDFSEVSIYDESNVHEHNNEGRKDALARDGQEGAGYVVYRH